jgi:hypothetical protein
MRTIRMVHDASIREFCRLTGRRVSDDPHYQQLVETTYDLYMPFMTPSDQLPGVVITNDGALTAACVTGDWEGVLIDETYLKALERVVDALITSSWAAAVHKALRPTMATVLWRRGARAAALVLRSERSDLLYGLDERRRAIALDESGTLERWLGHMRGQPRSARFGLVFAYLMLHEFAHCVLANATGDPVLQEPIGQARDAIERVRRVLTASSDAERAGSDEWLDALSEEVFCDRYTAGAFFARNARADGAWQLALVALLVIKEAKWLLDRAIGIAHDFCSDQSFLEATPSFERDFMARKGAPLALRGHVTSLGLGSFIYDIQRDEGDAAGLSGESIQEESAELVQQSRISFLRRSGMTVERCHFLALRATRAKLSDAAIRDFYDHIAARVAATTDPAELTTFDKLLG